MNTNRSTNMVLECKHITKKYKNDSVLKDINLTLESGKIYGLIGRNGAGKTTLLSILSAQNPATEGTVTLDGKEVWENQDALDNICFSRELNPSQGTGSITGLRVKDYLHIASIYYPNWDQAMADHLVKEFDLDIKKRMSKLSKGMLSMVTIIVALASKSQYTFLDEPVAGLDVFMRDKFYKLLIEEYSETGRTFIVSTHIIDEASMVLEDIIIISKGELLMRANTEDLLARTFHVSGKSEDVDNAVAGLSVYREETIGRSKGVTVILKENQQINRNYDIDIQPVSLQNVFLALCDDSKEK